jgi:hypothetical protein
MRLTQDRVKEAIEKSKSYSETARRLKVSRQRLWIFCQRHGLSIEKNSNVIARLTLSDIKELQKRIGLVKNRKSGYSRDKIKEKSSQRLKGP